MTYLIIEVDMMENDPIKGIGPFSSIEEAETHLATIEDGLFVIVLLISKEEHEKDLVDTDEFVPLLAPVNRNLKGG